MTPAGPTLGHIVMYVADIDKVAAFYQSVFGMTRHNRPGDRITELRGTGGTRLLLHPLAKGRKAGQKLVKLTFDVADVAGFVAASDGSFGPVHKAEGYEFANSRDPAGNPVQVSSRAFADWQDRT